MKQILICFLILSNFLSYSQTQMACDRSSDSSELVKFYQNFNGNQWNIRTNWLVPGKPMSTWSGILLDASGCIEVINLDRNKLNGVIFDFNFPSLRKLNIDYNKIRGTIPDFTKLSELNLLNLAHNELTESIPNYFSLAKLTNLDLANNLLDDSITLIK
ncbi:MAG: hypothetical protein V9E90_08170 [Saprospiraceae bacterium]